MPSDPKTTPVSLENPAHGLPLFRSRLLEVCRFFLRLGLTAFGGPAAHIAIMEDELVRRREWLSREQFLDLLGASNLIPGPSSSELAIHIGYLRAGWAGWAAGGICFILPAAIIVAALAWAYVRFGQLPAVAGLLYGVKPVVIGVVLQALWGLSRTAVKNTPLAALAVACAVAAFLQKNALLILVVAGVVAAVAAVLRERRAKPRQASATALLLSHLKHWTTIRVASVAGAAGLALGGAPTLWQLFLVFAKVGSVVFGSGYVLLAFLRADLVLHRGWVTDAQLVDAVAIGQITPGPVFTTATFLGFLLRGPVGAAAATVAIFLPAFLLVVISGPIIPHIRKSPTAAACLDGVNVASLAIMAAVGYQLARSAIVDWPTVGLSAASALLLLRFRVNSAWLVLGGGLVGLVLYVAR
jgi:chromate transporter